MGATSSSSIKIATTVVPREWTEAPAPSFVRLEDAAWASVNEQTILSEEFLNSKVADLDDDRYDGYVRDEKGPIACLGRATQYFF